MRTRSNAPPTLRTPILGREDEAEVGAPRRAEPFLAQIRAEIRYRRYMIQNTLPFVAGSDTSEAAAKSMTSRAAADREKILELFAIAEEDGLTADEVEMNLGMLHQTASARVSELWHKHQAICDSGKRRSTKSGRSAVVYVLVIYAPPRPDAEIQAHTNLVDLL